MIAFELNIAKLRSFDFTSHHNNKKSTTTNCQITVNDPINAFFLQLMLTELKQFLIAFLLGEEEKIFKSLSLCLCYVPLST